MATAVTALEISNENWETVCCIDDLVDNIGVCALVNGRQVAVFKLSGNDDLYAIDNYDPFSRANVLSRGIVGDLSGHPVVASPIFKQHFNLDTGRCLEDETICVHTYSVRVTDGEVQISV